jgi:ribosomal protein S18 acetylase RimI-like enzyme
VLARAGEYHVYVPSSSDAPRLRELEREFVWDHADLFRDEPEWIEQLNIGDWCRLVNVIEDEGQAHEAIGRIVSGKTLNHGTVQCVHCPAQASSRARGLAKATAARGRGLAKGRQGRGRGPGGREEAGEAGAAGAEALPRIVGYVHVYHTGGYLDISHLKVERDHQLRGLGALLMAGALKFAERVGWEVRSVRLVALARNKAAVGLYGALGFEENATMQRSAACSRSDADSEDLVAEWRKFSRPFRAESRGSLTFLCQSRADRGWLTFAASSASTSLPATAASEASSASSSEASSGRAARWDMFSVSGDHLGLDGPSRDGPSAIVG